MEPPLDILIDLIMDAMDAEEIVDILELTSSEIIYHFPEKIRAKKALFIRYLDLEDEDHGNQ